MNIEYLKLDDKVFVTSEDGHVSERKPNVNIEEILDCENKLEILENILAEDEENLEVVAILKRFFKKSLVVVPILILGIFPFFDFITSSFYFDSLLSAFTYFGSLLLTTIATEGVLSYFLRGCNKKSSGLINKLTECYAEINKLNNSLYKLRNNSISKDINLGVSAVTTKSPSFVALDDSYEDELKSNLSFCYEQGVKDYTEEKKKVKILKK